VNHFHYRSGELCCEDVPLERIAREAGTPTYVYSTATLTRHFRVMSEAFSARPNLICYAVKANSTLALLGLFAKLGSGFDIVSGGELYRVLHAGGDPRRVVFTGVGKTDEEIDYALSKKTLMFNVESGEELTRLAERARVRLRAHPSGRARSAQAHPSAHRPARESRGESQDAPVHRHRAAHEQVRHCPARGAAAVPRGRADA
jgi:diaminopimelate decarboxylase